MAENLIEAVDADLEVVDKDYDNEIVDATEYIISGYGADFDVEGLVRRLRRRDVIIPSFQRAYVWNRRKASRFVESLLMGLPVPGIFLYRERESQKLQVIDGQQRLRTLRYYYDGGIADTDDVFSLQGLESRFDGFAYEDLPSEDRRRLDNSLIHASIIHQEAPDDSGSSRYSIFERLNTSSTPLTPQEIRSAIYGGAFNVLLVELSENRDWRGLFGKKSVRKRDEELILRFLALFYDGHEYRAPMKGFLNRFMNMHRHMNLLDEAELRSLFERTVGVIRQRIGDKALKPVTQVNAAVADAVMVGVARGIQSCNLCGDLRLAHQKLLENHVFSEAISAGTSQPTNVRRRIELATQAFAIAE